MERGLNCFVFVGVGGEESIEGQGAVRDRGGTVSPSESAVSAGFLQTARKDWKVLESQLVAEPRDSVCAAPGKVPKVSEREKEQSAKASGAGLTEAGLTRKRGTEALEDGSLVEAKGGRGTVLEPFPEGLFLDMDTEEMAFMEAYAQHLSILILFSRLLARVLLP